MNSSINFDLDLFFEQRIGFIHLASAGGYVPEEIFSSPSHCRIRSLLLNKEALEFEYKLNPALEEIFSIKFEAQNIKSENFNREAYLRDFISYAKKGCLSFDRTFVSDPFDNRYHLVAYPIFKKENPFFLGGENLDKIIQEDFNRPMEFFY